MQVVHLADADTYDAPRHHGMTALRLQGADASGSQISIGLSHFLPGGGAERSASPLDRVYVVIDGEIAVVTDDQDVALRPLDSCWIPAGEMREVTNRTRRPASMLVVMATPRDDPHT